MATLNPDAFHLLSSLPIDFDPVPMSDLGLPSLFAGNQSPILMRFNSQRSENNHNHHNNNNNTNNFAQDDYELEFLEKALNEQEMPPHNAFDHGVLHFDANCHPHNNNAFNACQRAPVQLKTSDSLQFMNQSFQTPMFSVDGLLQVPQNVHHHHHHQLNNQYQQQQQQQQHNVCVPAVPQGASDNTQKGALQIEDFPPVQDAFKVRKFRDDTRPLQKTRAEVHKLRQRKLQRDYDKNICRYIARQCIRCFVDQHIYKDIVLNEYCNGEQDLYEKCKKFFLSRIEFVSGHRAFVDLLAPPKTAPAGTTSSEGESSEDDTAANTNNTNNSNNNSNLNSDPNAREKEVFTEFAKWFLRERATRYIISGNMQNKKQYVRFKNEVMLHRIQNPTEWRCNTKKIAKKKVVLTVR